MKVLHEVQKHATIQNSMKTHALCQKAKCFQTVIRIYYVHIVCIHRKLHWDYVTIYTSQEALITGQNSSKPPSTIKGPRTQIREYHLQKGTSIWKQIRHMKYNHITTAFLHIYRISITWLLDISNILFNTWILLPLVHYFLFLN